MFIDISSGDITTMIGYTNTLLGELLPVILVFLGITVAMFIYHAIKK